MPLAKVCQIVCAVATAVILSRAQFALAHGVVIGQSAAGDLKVHIEVNQPIELPPSVFPGIIGAANASPGIASAEIDESDEDLFLLDPGCDIQFIFIDADPGLQIVTSHVWVPGETFEFGPPFFDGHLVFNIPAGTVGLIYSLRFRLHDHNGVHADSPIYELSFTPVETVCACRGDTDADKALTGADMQSFIDCLMSTPSEGPVDQACACSDMDGDAALDDHDIEMLVDRLIASETCEE
ncbi:MAG: hypothetical protein HS101_13025 [Planctomycetia bacterium]|nr:hypothetical protein [Planctomycetia bacterium]MCC7313484.1 hypothetical protein [Planctomycetota bacterium]